MTREEWQKEHDKSWPVVVKRLLREQKEAQERDRPPAWPGIKEGAPYAIILFILYWYILSR